MSEMTTSMTSGELAAVVDLLRPHSKCKEDDDALLTQLEHEPARVLRDHGYRAVYVELEPHLRSLAALRPDVKFELRRLEQRDRALRRHVPEHTRKRNRRYAALRYVTEQTDHFSDEKMQERDPLLYHRYVGRFLPQEKTPEKRRGNGPLSAVVDSFDITHHARERLQQRADELGMSALPSEDLNDMLAYEQDSDEEAYTREGRVLGAVQLDEKRHELRAVMSERFVRGEDEPYFDYEQVDNSDLHDDLNEMRNTAEDAYFDEQPSSDSDVHR